MNKTINDFMEKAIRAQFMPHEDIYREKCRETLNLFLDTGFMTIKPFDQDDEQIIQGIEQRSTDGFANISDFTAGSQYFCRLLCYEKTKDLVYENGKISQDYTVFLVRPLKGSNSFSIKRTQLLYGNDVFDGTIKGRFNGPETFGKYIGTVDGNDYIDFQLPNKILESYCFNTVSRFNKTEICRRLLNVDGMSNQDLCKLVRKEILKAQAFALFHIINCPLITIKSYWSNQDIIGSINQKVWMDEFEKSCKAAFEERLRDVEAKLNELGIDYERVS